jgi:N-acetylglutamate synthase-like GNAT family acetyltransferase
MTPANATAAGLETIRVSTPLDFAQAALLLGEQRAWVEGLVGRELAEIQPSARDEYAHLADFYDCPHGKLVLARIDGEPVGVIAIRRIDRRRGEGKRLFVRPWARGAGVARRLVLELCSLARGLGFESLYIETLPGQMPEQYRWYRRLGFRETSKLDFADMKSVVAMELPLAGSPG